MDNEDKERFSKAMSQRTPDFVIRGARRIAAVKYRKSPNWVIAMELYGLGSTFARHLCLEHGVDPDGNQ